MESTGLAEPDQNSTPKLFEQCWAGGACAAVRRSSLCTHPLVGRLPFVTRARGSGWVHVCCRGGEPTNRAGNPVVRVVETAAARSSRERRPPRVWGRAATTDGRSAARVGPGRGATRRPSSDALTPTVAVARRAFSPSRGRLRLRPCPSQLPAPTLSQSLRAPAQRNVSLTCSSSGTAGALAAKAPALELVRVARGASSTAHCALGSETSPPARRGVVVGSSRRRGNSAFFFSTRREYRRPCVIMDWF